MAFTSQELWQIGISVGAIFLIIAIIVCLKVGLENVWNNFYAWCQDIDSAFSSFDLVTCYYEFMINMKIFSLNLYCSLIHCLILFIKNPLILVFFIATIIFSWICPIKGPTIIYKLLPVLYFIILLIYTFITMKKWDEDYEKKNKDMK